MADNLALLDLSRRELVEANAPALKDLILSTHTQAEAIAKLDYIRRLVDEVDASIRAELLPTMDGSYSLDAYNRYDVARVKMPARYEFVEDKGHTKARAEFETAKKRLKNYEDEMKNCGMAIDQNEAAFTIKLTERKGTKCRTSTT